jgi:hypothetical protein
MNYTHQVNYSKRFVTGLLEGKLYHDHLRFCSATDATNFTLHAKLGTVFAPCAGNGAYTIDDVSIIDLQSMFNNLAR